MERGRPPRKEPPHGDARQLRNRFETLFRPNMLRFKDPSTIYKWRLELDRFDTFLGRPALLADLTDETVGDAAEFVLAPKPDGMGLSIESTRGFLARIKKLWDFLAKKRLPGVVEFPTIENLRKQKRIPRAWKRHELTVLWEALRRQPGDIAGLKLSDWMCSFLTVMWKTSERPGAMLQVQWSDVDLRGGWLVIAGEKRKGGRQGRVYHLTEDCIEWLKRIREPRRDLVWPWPHAYTYLFPKWKEILRCAGLPYDRDRMFGCVRKSHASHLEAAGGDATQSLGHGERATTVEHYLDETIIGADGRVWPSDRLFRLDDRGEPRGPDDSDDPPRAA
jgi:integrase